MSMVRSHLPLILATALVGAACSGAPAVPDRPQISKAQVDRLEVKDQNFTEFTAVAHVLIVPEGGASLQARQATYEVKLDGDVRGTGTLPLGVEIPAEGGVVQVPVRATYAEGEKLASVLEREEALPLLFRGSIETSDGHVYEFSQAGRVRSPRIPEVKVWHVEAGAFPREQQIGLVFFVRLENRNPFEIQLEQLTYDLAVNGKKLIENGTAGRAEKIPPASMADLEIPVTVGSADLPDIARYIKAGTGMTYDIDGTVRLGVGRIPFELTGPIELGKGAPSE